VRVEGAREVGCGEGAREMSRDYSQGTGERTHDEFTTDGRFGQVALLKRQPELERSAV
jgi:hypothetical protein